MECVPFVLLVMCNWALVHSDENGNDNIAFIERHSLPGTKDIRFSMEQ